MAKVSLRAYNREIEAMVDRGHLDEAIAHCKHILKSFPKHLETYRMLGKAYLEYKRYPEAVDIFARVLVAVPNDFVANVGMSIIRDEEKKLDDAIWHMERAFETQPSNAAIQGELQRLYSRRDGVQLPRIRMTRGALAHMYVQGELYPQAISEIKSVLNEDPGRNDMQVLLARAYYRSGSKNDAAEVASALLRSDPYCLDANRVLVEILGADHPESVQVYRQRVAELDPYAAQVSGSIFLSDEVPDVAVSLERLDWNGQPVGMQSDWETTQAISLESGKPSDEQPDWLKSTFGEAPPQSGQPTPVSPFDAALPSAKPAEPAEDIPEFLREAGWSQSTGAFDESKSAFADAEREPASNEQPIAPGDLPDWVKAMAPEQPAETPAREEELPDWINKIGSSALPAASDSSDQPDWMSQLEQPSAQAAEEQPDWLKPPVTSEQPVASSEEQPDWLKGFENESTSSVASTGELDWLSQLGDESKPLETASNEFDVLNQPAAESQTSASTPSSDEFDFLNELADETEQLAPASAPEPSMKENLGMSSEEQEDSFSWLENLAAKQGATEGLLTKPEERLEEEPDWVKQAKSMDVSQPPVEQPPVTQPAGDLEELGKSEQEQDDSFAWLEGLAAKQGATEGLLTKPEERLEEEPEWIQQAKSLSDQPQEVSSAQAPQEEAEQIPVTEPEPLANLEEPSKSEKEREDSLDWLENLAAKQDATEGLLTKPEGPVTEEPDWVKQAKDIRAEQPSSADSTAAWLRSLDEEESLPAPEPVSAKDDTAIWLKSLDEPSEDVPPQPAQSMPPEDLPAWMQSVEAEKVTEAESTIPANDVASGISEKESADDTEWMSAIEQGSAPQTTVSTDEGALEVPTEDVPRWLSELDQEQEQAVTPTAMDADLPAWLRDETGEAVAEPTRIEPTHATDWQPVETKQPEPETIMAQPEVQLPEPEPVAPLSEVQPPQPEAVNVVNIIEEKIAALHEEEKPAAPPATKERKPKGTGRLGMSFDPILGQARNELSGSNVSSALESYARLIKKGRFLDEVIYDLRDALYRFPVDVDIWQSLGDAYMRANRLQDALDAYTKAEELLR
ncbi:MAG TPA: tetratricopeptide repeat protein [Anaerolineales bacterium]|nr:tetratricopeptide repeat protein [Anaerolineales bacterium]